MTRIIERVLGRSAYIRGIEERRGGYGKVGYVSKIRGGSGEG